ncbi:IS110 family transposase [Nesterenkonia sphaerica]|uniref:IS110 family transposase n=1 Tax=Nesterenkonia sphaerica TaxID=1804988 RepID=A0A5R9A6G5_9MICC|nr:IS110 family transposase [Nesterenkonia sphaerica]TLP74198.1 IS110 family transposase [Nesterenkonia sphaerica]
MEIYCGVDWAEAHHDVTVIDQTGRVLAHRRISADAAGLRVLLELLAEQAGQVQSVPVAIETEKNLIVVGLQAAGVTVYAINPRACARYRERHSQSGGKSDPGDALVLANILRTDGHLHRPLPELSDSARAIKVLARQHQEAIWAMHQTTSRLRSVLLEFYPQALEAFPNLQHRAALTFLEAFPSPRRARRLTMSRTVSLLRSSGRGNRAGLAERIRSTLRGAGIEQPEPVEEALALTAQTLVGILHQMHQGIARLEEALDTAFTAHPASKTMQNIPGLGPVTGARILAEIGDDPDRFASASSLRAYAGTAPVTRASGRSHYVKARRVRNKRLADACHWWAFASLTHSPGARAHYDRRRAAGDHHNAALRHLANKLLGRLWWCLRHNINWDEYAAWPSVELTPVELAA